MTQHDYNNGYRAGMQKMRDLAQARIDGMDAYQVELKKIQEEKQNDLL